MSVQEIPPFVFLGGTTGGPDWRKAVEEQLTIESFNPIVEEWTDEAKRLEDKAKLEATVHLYVITPYAHGVYSIAELTEQAIINPKSTVIVFLEELEGKRWSEHAINSNAAVCELAVKYGATVLSTIDAAVGYINETFQVPVSN